MWSFVVSANPAAGVAVPPQFPSFARPTDRPRLTACCPCPPNASARGIVITSSPGNQTVLTSAIAWLSVQGSDFRALFNGRPVVIATHSGSGGHTVLTALRLQLAHLSAQQP